MKRPAKPSHGLALARSRIVTMGDDELREITADRLIASYGLTLSEADHLVRNCRRV